MSVAAWPGWSPDDPAAQGRTAVIGRHATALGTVCGLRAGVEHVEPSLEDAYLLLRGAGTTPDSGHVGEVLS